MIDYQKVLTSARDIVRYGLEWTSEGNAAFTNAPSGEFVLYVDHIAREDYLLKEITRLRGELIVALANTLDADI